MNRSQSSLAASRYLDALGIRKPGYTPAIGSDSTLTFALMRALSRRSKQDRFNARNINRELATR